jgi:lipid-A-disaccharide synthase-like uncharacterized protein
LKRTWLWALLIVVGTVATLWACFRWLDTMSASKPGNAVNVKVQLEGARDHANLVRNPDGTHTYLLMNYDGTTEQLTPEQFASRLYRQQRTRSVLSVVFNISHPIGILWVCIGLLGQVLFTGRMVVQWLVSEKSKRSVVPPVFWWMSLIGSLMLLSYFTWRRDIVGILGQGFGLAIYLRNLYFIHAATAVVDESGEPVHTQHGVTS